MKKNLDKYFFSTTTYIVKLFAVAYTLTAILIAVKWYKTFNAVGAVIYFIIAIASIVFIYKQLVNKKLK
jgi:hypothetical protein